MPAAMPCVFTIDVEDWFHILDVRSSPPLEEWGRLESRVEMNVRRLLDLFELHRVHAVFFFLGWVAERFPNLVKEVSAAGHEIASHGYSHQLVYKMSRQSFYEDTRHSKELLEQITGGRILGFRATGFSVTDQTPWFFDELARAGYIYDSSVFPASRGHGGMSDARCEPHDISTDKGTITEYPVSVRRILGKNICLFGGGYLRLSPLRVILGAADSVLAQGRPVIFYLHPREIDLKHPRLSMPPHRRFKSYVGLRTVERKLHAILSRCRFVTFREMPANLKAQ